MAHEEGEEILFEAKREIRKSFYDMTEMVNVLYDESTTHIQGEISHQPKDEKGGGNGPPEDGDGGGSKPPPHPPPSSLSSPPTPTTPPTSPKGHVKSPLLKLDVKFELLMYDGGLNPEKLDNLVCQIEVYCKIQNIDDDATKIQLASLCL